MEELSWHDRGRLWLRLGLRLVLVLLFLWAFRAWGRTVLSVLAPFLAALLVAWVLAPVVRWLHRKLGAPRKFLTLLLLVLALTALVGGLWWLMSGLAREIVELAGNWEGLVASLQALADRIGAWLRGWMDLLPVQTRSTADSLVEQAFQWLETVIPALLSRGMDCLTGLAMSLPSFTVSLVVFGMASYFLTADYPRLRSAAADKLPRDSRWAIAAVKRAVSAGFGGYVKAEAILSVGVFFILLIGFFLIRQSYALLLALALAVLDFIPIVGSGTVLVPWAAGALLLGDFRHAMGLLAVWALVALYRRLAEPRVLGSQTGLPPILSLVSVYAGMKLGGVAGMILGPVVCLVVRNLWQAGLLDRTAADLKLAGRDMAAILRGGEEEK